MELDELRDEFDWMYEFQSLMAERIRGDADVHNLVDYVGKLEEENADLREQMERLITLLRNDCDIDASWDGLRRFWSIGLMEVGCLMRDRACRAEAENARLRDLVHKVERFERIGCHECPHAGCGADTLYDDDCPMRREIEQDKRELGVDA